MLGFQIAELYTEENEFVVPSEYGHWDFKQVSTYEEILKTKKPGHCATTFVAHNDSLNQKISDQQFENSVTEILDTCLILSFLTGKCVTPDSTTADSDIKFITLGDRFLLSRAIEGPIPVKVITSFSAIFSNGMPTKNSEIDLSQLRLILTYWLSSMTCYSLEDLYLGLCVLMDVVKQAEIKSRGEDLEYYEGMESASSRFNLNPLSHDFVKMRNDLVHEGKLSGSNFSGKNKTQCVEIITLLLNWIDHYLFSALTIKDHVDSQNRFKVEELSGFVSISLHV